MMNLMKKSLLVFTFMIAFGASYTLTFTGGKPQMKTANAFFCGCCPDVGICSDMAAQNSIGNTQITNEYITEEFLMQREWMVRVFFEQHILPAMMLFTEQISAMAMHQMVVIGSFLDAKQQLETQRLFQELTARAHKDYHPSEGMCVFGTNVRSLAASDRNIDLSAMGFSNRMRSRELLSGSGVTTMGADSDFLSRVKQFREIYCNPRDNANGLALLCPSPQDLTRANKDINYSATFDTPLTLNVDLTENTGGASADEADVFALAANLYAHIPAPPISSNNLKFNDRINEQGVSQYMNIRALAAKRSVATNSFASIAAMKSQGEQEVQPYLYALMREMGVGTDDPEEITKYLGERPSYFAQMEMLTKKLYQNPTFYTELYDKPANVERKNVSMQAIELMQKRDIYRSILRSEAILSVMLETSLLEEENKIFNEIPKIDLSGELVRIPD